MHNWPVPKRASFYNESLAVKDEQEKCYPNSVKKRETLMFEAIKKERRPVWHVNEL